MGHPNSPLRNIVASSFFRLLVLYLFKDNIQPTALNSSYEMEELYVKLFNLGYREMLEKMYIEWPQSVIKEQDKYFYKQIRKVVHGN
jgi:hypothetical protein